jgi:hypothetical protein
MRLSGSYDVALEGEDSKRLRETSTWRDYRTGGKSHSNFLLQKFTYCTECGLTKGKLKVFTFGVVCLALPTGLRDKKQNYLRTWMDLPDR